jgi:hypothetical protein
MGVGCFTKKQTTTNANIVKNGNISIDLNEQILVNFKYYNKLKDDDRNYKLNISKSKWNKNLIKLYLQHESYITINEKRNNSFTSNTGSTSSTHYDNYNNLKVVLITDYLCKAKTILMTDLLVKGPPNNIRWLIWISLVRTKYSNLNNEKIFNDLVQRDLKEDIVFQINKDLHRTAPENKYFQTEEGLKSLFNILKAIALVDHRVSYCQGINILAANILLLSDGNQYETFFFLRYMLEVLNVREFYTRGFPQLHQYIYVIKRLIKEKFINVHNKIESIGLPDEVWLFKWLQTLFSLTIDFSIVVRLWDCIIGQNDLSIIIKFCLALIKLFESNILEATDMSEFMDAFKLRITKHTKEEDVISLRESLITTALSINIDHYEEYKKDYQKTGIVNTYFSNEGGSRSSSFIEGNNCAIISDNNMNTYLKDHEGNIVTSIKRVQTIYETKEDLIESFRLQQSSFGSIIESIEDELTSTIKVVNVLEYKTRKDDCTMKNL